MKIEKKKIRHIPLRVRRKMLHLWHCYQEGRPVRRAYSPVQKKIAAVHEKLPPRFLLFDINQLCNLRCTHCDVWKNKLEDVVDGRTPERIQEIFSEFAQMSPHGTVVTCGGEPMYDPEHWFWLCKTAHQNGLPLLSVVNGTFIQTPEVAERVMLEGADEISISVDHYLPEIHDRMRGIPGSYDKALRALRLLLEARAQHPEVNKPIIVMALIGKSNYRGLEEFYDLVLNKIGADKLKLNMIQPTFGRPKHDRVFVEESDVDPSELKKILNRCDKRFSLGMNPVWKKHVVMYFRSLAHHKDLGKGWRSKASTLQCICNAFDRNIVIDIYGNARHCFSHEFHNLELKKPGDLKAFWDARGAWRAEMNRCNKVCGISHSLRAESGTKAGVRKAERFIEQSLIPPSLS